MTVVEFQHNVDNRLTATCKAIAAEVAKGRSVLAYAPDEGRAALLDKTLWTFNALSFVPHCLEGGRTQQHCPVVIAGRTDLSIKHDVLVNFSDETPPDFDRYASLVEIVGLDDADGAAAARTRFKFYRQHALEVVAIDMSEGRNVG